MDEFALECTQAIDLNWDEDEEEETNKPPELVGWLTVGDNKYEVFNGETKIGRDPTSCQIVLAQKVLSNKHAVIEVENDVHTIADLESRNKTRLGKRVLKPNIRYALQGGETIFFGDVKSIYTIKPKDSVDDSGSETGSESMLQLDESDRHSPSPEPAHQLKGEDVRTSAVNGPNTSCNLNSTFNDSDVIPATQENKQHTSALVTRLSPLHSKTVIPESPSMSQSTPLPHKKKNVSFIPETPGNTSGLENVTSDNDSFFFELSQPVKGKVSSDARKEEMKNLEEKHDVIEYNSDASTDMEDEAATQPYEDFVDKGKVVDSRPGPSKGGDDDDDIFDQATQVFSAEESTMPKSPPSAQKSKIDNPDNTQDILDAFGDDNEKEASKCAPKCSHDDDDDDNDFVPTQLFFDDESDVFKVPQTFAPKSKKISSNLKTCKTVSESSGEEIFDVATQPFDENVKSKATSPNEKDFFEAETQLFSEDAQQRNNNDSEEKSKNDHNNEDDTDDIFNQQTQVFTKHYVEDDCPTQLFESPEKKATSGNIDDKDDDDFFNEPTQPFISKKDKDDEVFDAPTQLFEDESIAADSKSKDVGGGKSGTPGGSARLDNDDLPPTQLFDQQDSLKTMTADDKDEETFLAPTQPYDQLASEKVIAESKMDGDDDLAETLLYDPYDLSPKPDTGESDGDDLAPTQVFDECNRSRQTPKVEKNLPTTSKADFNTPSRNKQMADDDEEMTPTQIFKPGVPVAKTPKRFDVDDDDLTPTQPFHSNRTPRRAPKPTCNDDDLTPTQVYKPRLSLKKAPINMNVYDDDDEYLIPTQKYSPSGKRYPKEVKNLDDLPPTQLYCESHSPSHPSTPSLPKSSTKSFTLQMGSINTSRTGDVDDLAPTQPYCRDPQRGEETDGKKTVLGSDINEAPTQPYGAVPGSPTQPYGAVNEAPTQPYGAVPGSPTQPYGAVLGSPTQPYNAEVEAPTQPYNAVQVGNTGTNSDNHNDKFSGSSKLEPQDEGAGIDFDADATQELDIDGVVGIDEIRTVVNRSPRKSTNIIDKGECGNDSDVDSEASETLLNERSCGDGSDIEGMTPKEVNLKAKKTEEENYYSDESTDIEDNGAEPPSINQVNKEGSSSSLEKPKDQKKNVEHDDNDGDANSEASESLLNDDSSVDEKDGKSKEEMEGRSNSSSVTEGENAKIDNYKSDESTDMEDNTEKPSSGVKGYKGQRTSNENDSGMEVKEGSSSKRVSNKIMSTSPRLLTQMGTVSPKDISSTSKVTPSKVAENDKLEDDSTPQIEKTSAEGTSESVHKEKHARTPGSSCSETPKLHRSNYSAYSQNSANTEDLLALDIHFADSDDSTDSTGDSDVENNDVTVLKTKSNENHRDFSSSDSESDGETLENSPVLFNLTPSSQSLSPSKGTRSSVKKSVGKRLMTDQSDKEANSDFSGFGDSPKKKICGKVAQTPGNKTFTETLDKESCGGGAEVAESKTLGDSPNKKRHVRASRTPENRTNKEVVEAKKSDSDEKVKSSIHNKNAAGSSGYQKSLNEPEERQEIENVEMKVSINNEVSNDFKATRQTRKRTQSVRKLFPDKEEDNEISSKVQKLEKKKKSDNSQDDCSEASFRSSKTAPKSKVRTPRRSARGMEHSEEDNSSRDSSLSELKEVTHQDVRSTRLRNRRHSTSSTVSNVSQASSSSNSGKRTRGRKSAAPFSHGTSSSAKQDENIAIDGKQQEQISLDSPKGNNKQTSKRGRASRGRSQAPSELPNKRGRKSKIGDTVLTTNEIPTNKIITAPNQDHLSNEDEVPMSEELQKRLRGKAEELAGKQVPVLKTRGRGRQKTTDIDANKSSQSEESTSSTSGKSKGKSNRNSSSGSVTVVNTENVEGSVHGNREDGQTTAHRKSSDADLVKEKQIPCSRRETRKSEVAKTKNEEDLSATGEGTSQLRTSGRTRRKPMRFSPAREVESPLPTPKKDDDNVSVCSSVDSTEDSRIFRRSIPMRKRRLSLTSDNESQDTQSTVESLPVKRGCRTRGKQSSDDEEKKGPIPKRKEKQSLSTDSESQGAGSMEDFALPAKRGRRTRGTESSGGEEKVDPAKQKTQSRNWRASIATSQPSSQESFPSVKMRLSIIPEASSSEVSKEDNKNSRTRRGRISTKGQSLSANPEVSSAEVNKEDNKNTTTRKGRTSTKGQAQRAISELPSEVDKEDSRNSRTRRGRPSTKGQAQTASKGMSNLPSTSLRDLPKNTTAKVSSDEVSEKDSQDSQESVGRRGRSLPVDKLPSTPKSNTSLKGKQIDDQVLWSPSQRQMQASTRPRVLFTGYVDQQDEKIVTDLGGKVVDSCQECSVLVATGVKRTCKLLVAMGKGIPIVSPSWLIASKQARNFVDPWEFLVKDAEAEKKYGFRLEQSLRSATKYQLFEGLEIHATKSVKPPPTQMKEIIEGSGGQYLDMPPKRYAPQIRIVSCPEDKASWAPFRRVGIPILGTEFILTGLLRHQLLLDEFEIKS